jgi:hypothetical protein
MPTGGPIGARKNSGARRTHGESISHPRIQVSGWAITHAGRTSLHQITAGEWSHILWPISALDANFLPRCRFRCVYTSAARIDWGIGVRHRLSWRDSAERERGLRSLISPKSPLIGVPLTIGKAVARPPNANDVSAYPLTESGLPDTCRRWQELQDTSFAHQVRVAAAPGRSA